MTEHNGTFAKGCLVSLIITAIPLMIIFRIFVYPLFVAEKTVDTLYDITSQTLDAKNVIYNYEWFKTQHEAVKSQKQNLDITQNEYNNLIERLDENSGSWSKFQQQEESSLRNSLSASKKVLNQLIAEYNAKSDMVNRSIFKQGLPERLELVE